MPWALTDATLLMSEPNKILVLGGFVKGKVPNTHILSINLETREQDIVAQLESYIKIPYLPHVVALADNGCFEMLLSEDELLVVNPVEETTTAFKINVPN